MDRRSKNEKVFTPPVGSDSCALHAAHLRIGKRGNIVAINNDNILIPCYGKGNGENPYGAPATKTGRNDFGAGSYHADCVLIQYQRNSDNEWVWVDETQVGQEIDETGDTQRYFWRGALTIELVTGNEDKDHYDNSTAVRIDNILVTRNYKADAEMYNVNLVTNGGSIQEGCEVINYIEGVGKTLPTAAQMTRSGYTFAGWYESDTFDPTTAVTEITIDDTGDKTYYAKWLADNPDAAEEEAGRESDITDSGVPNESETPEVTGTITHSGRSLSLDGTVLINQYVTIDGFEGIDLEANGGLLIFKDEVTEETATVENADYDQAGLTYDAANDRYVQQSHGITEDPGFGPSPFLLECTPAQKVYNFST